MKKKGLLSLNRALLRTMMVAGSAIVLFLVLLDGYWIAGYQANVRSSWKAALTGSADRLSADLAAVSSDVFDIYSYDTNFQALETSRGIESLPFAHELDERLKTLQMLRQRSGGYILYYNGLQNRKYYFSQGSFTHKEIEELKNLTAPLETGSQEGRAWHYYTVCQKAFAVALCKSQGVAIGEVCCLEETKTELEEELSSFGAEVFFMNRQEVLGNDEHADRYREFSEISDTVKNQTYVLKKG